MKTRNLFFCVVALTILLVLPLAWSSSPSLLAQDFSPATIQAVSDEFDSTTLGSHWTWVDPDSDGSYSLTANPGHLRITTPCRDNITPAVNEKDGNCNAGRVMQSISGDFTVETKVILGTVYNASETAGILIWQSKDNHLILSRTYEYSHQLLAEWAQDGVYDREPLSHSSSPTFLRIQRNGSQFVMSYSTNGSDWTTLRTETVNLSDTVQIGLVVRYVNNCFMDSFSADFDYFYVNEGAPEAPVTFTKHIVDTDFGGAYCVDAADVDKDGDIDVVGAGIQGGIAWWENDGIENFTKHSIDSFYGARFVHVIDLDSDGDTDVLGSSRELDEVAWWENDGSENFTKHSIDNSVDLAHMVHATDIDGDGDVDVLGAAPDGDEIAWWENSGSESFTKHTIDGSFDGAWGVYAIDLDGDGDIDVLGTANVGDNVAWYQNDGSQNFTKHIVDAAFDGAVIVYATDVDGDGDVDILSAAWDGEQIAWWENDGNEAFTKHVLRSDIFHAMGVYAIDLDGDTDTDILGTGYEYGDVFWWENDGNENFTERLIDSTFSGASFVYATDVDKDGDVDVLGACTGLAEITWWENGGVVPDTTPPDTKIVSGPSRLTNVTTVTFEFTGTDDQTPPANLLYSYKLDEDVWSSYSSDTTVTLSGLSEGKYTFYVKAKDAAGHEDPTPAEQAFEIDLSAREVILFNHSSYHGASDTEIYMINPDGSGLTRLTTNNYMDWCPRVSPDGRSIAFVSKKPDAPGLYVMNTRGENKTLVSGVVDRSPLAWSPDSTKVAVNVDLDGNGIKIYTVDVPAGTITAVPSVAGDYRFDWSPDGTKLVMIHDPWLMYVQNFDGTDRHLVTSTRPRGAAWNPSSNRIVYEEYMGNMHIVNPDGTNNTRIPTAESAYYKRWSPDGTKLVYSTLGGGRVRIIKTDGTNDHVVPNVPGGWIGWLDWGLVRLNSPPELTADQTLVTADEGQTADNSGTVSDPDNDPVTLDASVGTVTNNGDGTWSWSFATSDGPTESQTVTISADDGHGGTAETTFDLTVNNVVPTVDAGNDATIDEGDTFTGSGSFADPGADTWTATIDYDGSGTQPLSLNPDKSFDLSHTYADNGIYTAKVCVTDDDGDTGCDSLLVTVLNVAPLAGAITAPADPVQVDTAISANADFTDRGVLDTHTAEWEWGDGNTSSGTVNETNGSGSVGGTHTYTTAGVYTLRLTVTDKDGDSGESVFQFVVVYDPQDGFVTGGGWIDSPEGAYAPDPSLTGRATFGFVSKYKKGAAAPTGQTQFQFRVADLNFHSDSYEWLVVAGPKAMFKGAGIINGAGNYGFLLSAVDENLTPSTDVDLFRIKIWDKEDGDEVIYDNQMGASDDADPTTAIGGGNIVIHKQ